MAFRLHHYEALKSDKESLQMPLNGMFRGRGRTTKASWAFFSLSKSAGIAEDEKIIREVISELHQLKDSIEFYFVQKTTLFVAVNMANNSKVNAYLENQFTKQYKSHDSHLTGSMEP
jgi:hypothetical protein